MTTTSNAKTADGKASLTRLPIEGLEAGEMSDYVFAGPAEILTVEPSFKEVEVVQLGEAAAGVVSATVESIQKQIDDLRSGTDSIDERWFAPGRKAIAEMVGTAYAVYKAVMESPHREKLIAYIRSKLYVLDKYEPTINVKETSLFLRYTFKCIEEKQRHLYGRALTAALALNVEADGFGTWVKSKGGFEAIRVDATVKGKEPHSGLAAHKCIVNDVQRADDFAPELADDDVVVLIAVRGEDGGFSFKDSKLDETGTTTVLKLVDKQRTQRLKALASAGKPEKRVLSNERKFLKLNARGEVHNAEVARDDVKLELAKATARGDLAKAADLQTRLLVANATLQAAIAKRKYIAEAL